MKVIKIEKNLLAETDRFTELYLLFQNAEAVV